MCLASSFASHAFHSHETALSRGEGLTPGRARGWVAECAVCGHEGVGVSERACVRGDASVCMVSPSAALRVRYLCAVR